MNKMSIRILCTTLSLLLVLGVVPTSTAENVCNEKAVAFLFFNGVRTTKPQADAALQELRRIHGDQSAVGDKIGYEVMYNYSDGFEDFVETFDQRLSEQSGLLEGRFELFFEALNGDGPWWSVIIGSIDETAGILSGLVDWYQAAAIQNLTTLLANPPTISNYQEHRLRIDNRIVEGKKLLLVAHSQGNLFMNSAYSYALSKTSSESVKAVHIAPASPSLSGAHVLADLDLVINGLRPFGSVPSITEFIPGYLLRPPGANGKRDVLGHGLLEIYINQSLNISSSVKLNINSALASLEPPPTQASSGFFTATLTWNGSGDVDLHTYEPSGRHVYYASSQGDSGYLDVDNVTANGPEHYFADCDSDNFDLGIYRIAIANYSRADGRTATVQIDSSANGVLGTESVTLGAATGSTPSVTMFEVLIAQDPETAKYVVSIAP